MRCVKASATGGCLQSPTVNAFVRSQKHWMKKIVGGDRSGSRSRAPKSLSPYNPLPMRVFAIAYRVEVPAQNTKQNRPAYIRKSVCLFYELILL